MKININDIEHNICSLLEDLSIVEYAVVEKLLLNIKDVDLNKLEKLL